MKPIQTTPLLKLAVLDYLPKSSGDYSIFARIISFPVYLFNL